MASSAATSAMNDEAGDASCHRVSACQPWHSLPGAFNFDGAWLRACGRQLPFPRVGLFGRAGRSGIAQ